MSNLRDGDLQRAICSTIRRLRRVRGISQEELALAAQIDRSYVSGIERMRRNISISLLEKIIPHLSEDYPSFLKEVIKELEENDLSL